MGRSPARPRRTGEAGRIRGGDLAGAVLGAAEVLIGERGPRGFSLREVARRARVSEAAPYWHFSNKEALLAGVAERGFVALAAAMEEIGQRVKDPSRRLKALGIGYVRFALERPASLRIMFGPEIPDKGAHPSLRAAAERAFSLLVSTVSAAQRAGSARRGDARKMATSAWALVHGLSALLIDGQLKGHVRTIREAEILAGRLTELLWTGLESPATRRHRRDG